MSTKEENSVAIDVAKFNSKVEEIIGDFPQFPIEHPNPDVKAVLGKDLKNHPTKECDMCGESLPLHGDFFHADASRPDGFRSVCKGCRNLHLQSQKVAKQAKAINKFREKLSDQVLDHSQQVTTTSGRRDNVGKMYESILNAFGGIDMFGATVANVFVNATEATQQKLVQNIISLSKNVTEMGMADKNLEDMSEEEILQELMRRAKAAGFSKVAEDAKNKLKEMDERSKEKSKAIEVESIVIKNSTVIGDKSREMTYEERGALQRNKDT